MVSDKHDSNPKKKSDEKSKPTSISYFRIFRFATPFDFFLIFIAFICAVLKTIAMPLVMIIYGEFCSLLVDRTYGIGTSTKTDLLPLFGGGKILTNASAEENTREIYNDSIAYGGLMTLTSLIYLIVGTVSIDLFNYTALKQITRIRSQFFQSIIIQDIGWHDIVRDQNFALRITDDIEKIRDGIAEKVSHFINFAFGFITALATSLYYGWKLTLAVTVYLPVVIIVNIVITKYQSKLTTKEMNSYSVAAQIAEEVFGAIRTVIAFNGENKESERYENALRPAFRSGKRKGIFSGIAEGVMRSLLFLSCAGAFWYGVHLVLEGRGKEYREYNPGVLTIVFFAVFIGADSLSRLAPILETFAKAKSSAATIFHVIDIKSKIDPLSKDGQIAAGGIKGDIEFQDVFFAYPSRDDVIVHRGLNLSIEGGQTVALVGHSGCGKSSCIQLLQRFYDPVFGQILIDGIDIRRYNLKWLRSNIAIVGQEPVLFAGTIGDNISYGKPGCTQKEIEEAAKASGIHDFVSGLPESYNSVIGEKSTQLSGGQKQRVAIARALIQNPKILLLDEATSALDYHSEKLVQEALDAARKGRTTIVVSHRLSAIKNADKIVFIENGKAVEEGTHSELMQLNGKYATMVSVGNVEEPGKENLTDLLLKDDTFNKSFETDVNNLQEYYEHGGHTNRNSLDPNSIPLLGAYKVTYDDEEDDEKLSYAQAFRRVLKVARPEYPHLIIGILLATICGCTYLGYAIVFGEFYAALSYIDDDTTIERTRILCIICLVVGVVALITGFLQTYLFNVAALNLAIRLRFQAFKSIVIQEVAWFDLDKNSVGALSARLSGDAADVTGAIGYPMSSMIQAVNNMLISVGISFYYSWKLTLVCLASVPIIVGTVLLEARYMAAAAIQEKELLEQASAVATEAITNIRTVAGLRREANIIADFNREVQKVETGIKRRMRFRGIVNSSGMSAPFLAYAAALCYGGVLVSTKQIPFQDTIKVSEILLYGAMILGQSFAFVPAFTASLVAANRLFQLIDRRPRIQSPNIIKSTQKDVGHGVNYNNVNFRYPKRPDAPVLQNFSLEIPEGKTVALVGPSGSGKSTCVQLLQRLYQTDHGSITIGQNDICKDLTLLTLRQKLGLVSQEPVLFERTIAENIAYGDNSRQVTLQEIMDCAKMANIHNFVSSLPVGYDTKLGSKGTQLSGGEKQRIAIARALIRNPKVLLLDEATSALDLQSEKIVQAALEFACSGRTCIVIAHRLSSIQNADLICVIQHGKLIEKGNHAQLMEIDGVYARLYRTQPKLNE